MKLIRFLKMKIDNFFSQFARFYGLPYLISLNNWYKR
jgi:hypothetical protein